MNNRSRIALAAQILVIGLLSACGSSSTIETNTALGTPGSRQLSPQQRKIVDAAVRQIIKDQIIKDQIIKDKGTAILQSMNAASAKQSDQTDVCGYVTYAAPVTAGSGTVASSSSSAPTQVRYFIRLGIENGKQAAVMGQVASTPAKRAKVTFMCQRAGLN